jgi:serine protease inhibitor
MLKIHLNDKIMKAFQIIITFIMIISLNAACKKDVVPVAPGMKQVQLSEKQKQVINSNNAFGFDFFRKVNEYTNGNSNLMVSPLSVSMALGMTRNGARGTTLEGMNQTLGFGNLTDQEIDESYKYIVETFTGLDPKVKLSIANSIWYNNGFTVEQPFIITNQQYFNASVTPLDFASPSAVSTINSWVNEKTNQLIPKIIDVIPEEAVMYLINAVYFKGQWKYKFDAANTNLKPFYLADHTQTETQSMQQHSTLPYMQRPGFNAVEMPYNQGNFTMTVLLPDADKTVNDVITQLTQENWATWNSQFTNADIQLQLPKFKYEYDEAKMKTILSDMGMGLAFDPDNADFSGINSNGGLYISDVKHKTFIETNEEGTEAAAVTVVAVGTTSAGPDQPIPILMTIDRPFVYFIQEKSTGTVLFIGTVMNPNE